MINKVANDRGIIRSLYQRKESGFDIYLCEYHSWSSGPVDSPTITSQVIVAVTASQTVLPRIYLQTTPKLKGAIGSLALKAFDHAMPSDMVKLIFEKEPFKDRFLIYANEDCIAVRKMAESIMTYLKGRGNVSVDINKDTILITNDDLTFDMVQKNIDMQKVKSLVAIGQNLYQRTLS
jgi:hypothetical protein